MNSAAGWLLPATNRPVGLWEWLRGQAKEQAADGGTFADVHAAILDAHVCAEKCDGHPGPWMQHGDYCEYRCEDCGHLFPCHTVRLLATGYRHRPGWNPDWAPEGITP